MDVERFPVGEITTISGGTRDEIKLNRPWQVQIRVDPENCPFALGVLKEEEIIKLYRGGEWLLIENIFTPRGFHQMLVPKECWVAEKLWDLGGIEEITLALGIIEGVVRKNDHDLINVGVHSGYLAGQNIPHLHYHIFDPAGENISIFKNEQLPLRHVREVAETDSRIIFRHNGVTVVAGGHRAGQCYLFIDGHFDNIRFGEAVHRLLALYADKFRSVQGLPPDFGVGLVFKEGNFCYGTIVPVLNNWCVTEYLALMGAGVICLPWSHEKTAAHLRSGL